MNAKELIIKTGLVDKRKVCAPIPFIWEWHHFNMPLSNIRNVSLVNDNINQLLRRVEAEQGKRVLRSTGPGGSLSLSSIASWLRGNFQIYCHSFTCFCRGCLPSDASWFWRTRPAFCTLTLTTWRSRAKSPGMGLICSLYSDTCTQIYYTIGSTVINTLIKQLHIMVLSHNHIDISWSTLWAIDIIIFNQSYSIIYIVMTSSTQVFQHCALCKRI